MYLSCTSQNMIDNAFILAEFISFYSHDKAPVFSVPKRALYVTFFCWCIEYFIALDSFEESHPQREFILFSDFSLKVCGLFQKKGKRKALPRDLHVDLAPVNSFGALFQEHIIEAFFLFSFPCLSFRRVSSFLRP